MKISIAQLNYRLGNFEYNVSKILDVARQAVAHNSELIVFSEMGVCGFPVDDLLLYPSFIAACKNAIQQIAEARLNIGILVGAPYKNDTSNDKKPFNSVLFIHEGKVKQCFNKTVLNKEDILNESKYFEAGESEMLLEFKGKKIMLAIGEDIVPAQEETDIVLNITASPFSYTQYKKRIAKLKLYAVQNKVALAYINQVGAHTDLIFDGGSLLLNVDGIIKYRLPYFKESVEIFDISNISSFNFQYEEVQEMTLIHDALIMGIRDYFKKTGFKKAILGLSGGLDSALVLYLAVKALGSENVMNLLLPSQFSTQHSIDDALQLCKNLNVQYETISIQNIFEQLQKETKPYFNYLPFDVTEENMQARIRGILLMAFSNKFGFLLLNTTNKSEAAMGYGTLYGDTCGGLSVLGDVYKTQEYQLANYINKDEEIIPQNIITKAPSAELRPNQKDSDSLPDYKILDQILFAHLEAYKSEEELVESGFDKATVKHVLQMISLNEWKRYQAAPALRISSKSFGRERKMMIV